MKRAKYDLGQRSLGDIVEVTLSLAANVRLLDRLNYQNYRNGRRHEFYGGYCETSPVRMSIPRTGYWYVAVDLDGYAGRVKSSVRVIALPESHTAGQEVDYAPELTPS